MPAGAPEQGGHQERRYLPPGAGGLCVSAAGLACLLAYLINELNGGAGD